MPDIGSLNSTSKGVIRGLTGTKIGPLDSLYAPYHAYSQIITTVDNQGIMPGVHTNVKFDSVYDDEWGMISLADNGFKIPATWGTAAMPFGVIRFAFMVALKALSSETAAQRAIRASITNSRLGVGNSWEMPIVTSPIPTGLRGFACAGFGLWDWDVAANDIFTVDIYHDDPGTPTPTVVTFDLATERVTWASHGMSANRAVHFSGGTLPTELTANTVYYIRDVLAGSFTVSATSGGAAIALSGSPSGTTTCTPGRNMDYSVAWFTCEMS